MRAARIADVGDGAAPVVQLVPDPRPGDGEAVVRVTAAAVAHLDRTIASGRFATSPPPPYVPGTDGAGTVLTSAAHPPGTPVRIRGGDVGVARDGTWAELVAVPDAALHPLPAGVPPALAATFYSPAATAALALHHVGDLRPGEHVVVTGAAGAVGSLAVQLALHAGAPVTAVVGAESHRDAVPPGVAVVVGRGAVAAAQLRAGPPADLLVDTVGGPRLADLVGAVRPGGRVALVGYTAGTQVAIDLAGLLQADVRLLPVNLLRLAGRAAELAPRLLTELVAGRLRLHVRTFPLADAAAALDHLASGAATGRVALLP